WIRIFILILVGYHTEMESSLMEDHETFGWIVFALICFPAIYFAPVIKVRSSIALPSTANNTPALGKLILLFLLLLPGVILTRLVAATDNGEQAEYHLTDKDFMPQALSLPLPLSLPVAAQTQQFISPAKIY